ncbi:FtsK/SpoIIIE domain-containing protein [Terrabacter sp. Root181]|uniref:FtsK/SpoIIIE domain-containing protein n=1 Tax=Terrabacter sp. Root181 TaxID=1736484 RepID=UPI000AFBECBE|nr:FtsK/SpoIIIE domain-containing protein [Terrabacter sp. Root181]
MAKIVVDTNNLRALAAAARMAADEVMGTTGRVRGQLLDTMAESGLLGSAIFKESLSDLGDSSERTVDALMQIASNLTAVAEVFEQADSQLSATLGRSASHAQTNSSTIIDLLFPGTEVRGADRLMDAIARHWSTSAAKDSLPSIPIGMIAARESSQRAVKVRLDSAQPHLLIAGRTGSGKTVLIRNVIAGLAMSASPQDVMFLFLDGRGGQFEDFYKFPHVLMGHRPSDGTGLRSAYSRIASEVRMRLSDRQNMSDVASNRRPRLVIVMDEPRQSLETAGDFARLRAELSLLEPFVAMHIVASLQSDADVQRLERLRDNSARIVLANTEREVAMSMMGGREVSAPASDGSALLFETRTKAVRRFTPSTPLARSELDMMRRAIRAAASAGLH